MWYINKSIKWLQPYNMQVWIWMVLCMRMQVEFCPLYLCWWRIQQWLCDLMMVAPYSCVEPLLSLHSPFPLCWISPRKLRFVWIAFSKNAKELTRKTQLAFLKLELEMNGCEPSRCYVSLEMRVRLGSFLYEVSVVKIVYVNVSSKSHVLMSLELFHILWDRESIPFLLDIIKCENEEPDFRILNATVEHFIPYWLSNSSLDEATLASTHTWGCGECHHMVGFTLLFVGVYYTFGYRSYGRLGYWDEEDKSAPSLVRALVGKYKYKYNAVSFTPWPWHQVDLSLHMGWWTYYRLGYVDPKHSIYTMSCRRTEITYRYPDHKHVTSLFQQQGIIQYRFHGWKRASNVCHLK